MSRTRPFILIALVLSAALAPLSKAQQTGVSRKPPAAYEQFIAPLLTPIEEALKISKDLAPDDDFSGAVILNEIIHRVDDDGGRLIAIHSIYRADSEAGVDSLHSNTQSFRSAHQKIHLALARTISPDGTKTPVRENAVLIQSPQRNANQSLYSDTQEMLVVFPKIKPGTLTESIVVIEEDAMRVPGEFMTSSNWGGGWPQGLRRMLIDVPEKLGERLKFTRLGRGAPKVKESRPEEGRQLFELSRRNVPGSQWEIGLPPVSQSGPATWITSFKDWEAFGDWYRPLIKDRATLNAELAAKVDEWTADAADEEGNHRPPAASRLDRCPLHRFGIRHRRPTALRLQRGLGKSIWRLQGQVKPAACDARPQRHPLLHHPS